MSTYAYFDGPRAFEVLAGRMEARPGLLVRDRSLAASVASHFRTLIDRKLLAPLPQA